MFADDSAGLREGQGRLAKDSNHRADAFDTDNTGGLLSGLLAEEEDLDRRALWRIGSWGVGAVAAVVVAVLANQSSLGLKREQMAALELSRQAQQIQMAARENQAETRRLANAVDTLNGDRDRLYTRVTSLEQGLDSVTGSFIRQLPPNALTPPSLPAIDPSAALASAPVVGPVATAAAATEKPGAKATEPSPATVSAVTKDPPKAEPGKADKAEAFKADVARLEAAKTDTAKAEAPKGDAAKADLAKADLAKPDATKPDVTKADVTKADAAKPDAEKTPAATPATPLVAAKSFMAPPDPSATKLIEPNKPVSAVVAAPIPEVVATAPVSDEEADEATAPKVALQRTEFGVDLGTANSLNGLRALWRGLLKSRSNAPLQALRPVIMIKESTKGLGMQLHLVAGPLNDAGTAAKICAVMTENDRLCETTVFDGQRLSFKPDEVTPAPATPAKPTSTRRHGGSSKRAAAAAPVEEPKKPETTSSISSSISSMFSRKKPE